jgi:hypothetical protein
MYAIFILDSLWSAAEAILYKITSSFAKRRYRKQFIQQEAFIELDIQVSEISPSLIDLRTNCRFFVCFYRLKDENAAASLKTLWPINCREFIFLPEFKVHNEELKSKYEIIDFIASGAFGRVFKVRQHSTSQIFALKVLEKSKVRRSRSANFMTLANIDCCTRLCCSTFSLSSYL